MASALNLPDRPRLLWRAMRALATEPGLMAGALIAARRRGALTDAELAAHLALSPERLPVLALCRRPDPTTPDFSERVEALARFVGCDPVRLRDLLLAGVATDGG
jgi:hypothetical protein